MKRIAILGSSGFIGVNLLQNLSESFGISLRNENWIQYINRDVKIIINLVGKAHDHKREASEKDFYYANVDLTKDIYNAFIKSDAKLLIHISSLAAIEEYKANQPLGESDPCHPESWYGKSKREAEVWLLSKELPFNKKLIIMRPPMVHGPGDKGNLGLLYKFVSKGIPYPLSSFENSRSFISITNLIYFIQQVIEKCDLIQSGIYHVADDEPVSTKQIIQIIKTETGRNNPDISVPKVVITSIAKLGDILPIPLNSKRLGKMTSNLLVSNSKIKKSLGIDKLPLTAKEGLEITIKSFNQVK